MSNFAIIPAGGKGKRCDENLPKQFHQVNGKEIIVYTLEIFQNSSFIDNIAVAVHSEYLDFVKELVEKYQLNKVYKIVEGGKERQDSVFNALNQIDAADEDLVIVHDAARPLLKKEILEKAVKQAYIFDNVLVCIEARDTLLRGEEFVSSYLERKGVFYVQTPQIFKYAVLKKSMELAYKNGFYGTDESMLVKNAGFNIRIVEGSLLNFKITNKEDIELFTKFINAGT